MEICESDSCNNIWPSFHSNESDNLMSSGEYLHGQYKSVGPSRHRGGCVEAEFITISDSTLQNVLISKEAFDLLELGEVVELVYYQQSNITYITYLRYNDDKISPMPNFANRVMNKVGFKAMGCSLVGVLIISFMYPEISVAGGSSTLMIPAIFGASLILAAGGYFTTFKKVLATKSLFPGT